MGMTLLAIALIGIVLEVVVLIWLLKNMIWTIREIERMDEEEKEWMEKRKGGKSNG